MIWLLPTALVVLAFGWLVGEIAERRALRITCAVLFILGSAPAVVTLAVSAFFSASNVSLALTGAMARWFEAADAAMTAGHSERLHEELQRVQINETHEWVGAVHVIEESAARLRSK
jgi:hypothetical protein